MNEQLDVILGHVNDWLRFAEAKNGILLTLSSGLAFAMVKERPPLSSDWLGILYSLSATLFFLCAGVCLFSFVPQIKIPWLTSLRRMKPGDNLYFFGHLAMYSPGQLCSALHKKTNGQVQAVNELDKDVASQIVVNAKIAVAKYRYFTLAIWLALLGSAFLAVVGMFSV